MIGGVLTERTVGAVLPAVKDNMEKLKVAHFCLHASMLMCGCRRGSPVCACVRVSLLVRCELVLWWAPGLRSGEPAGLYERGRGATPRRVSNLSARLPCPAGLLSFVRAPSLHICSIMREPVFVRGWRRTRSPTHQEMPRRRGNHYHK